MNFFWALVALAIGVSSTSSFAAKPSVRSIAATPCGAMLAASTSLTTAALSDMALAEVVAASWDALVAGRGNLLQKVRQEIFPIVARAVAARAKAEGLKGAALQAAAAAEVSRLNTLLFPKPDVPWYKTLVSIFILALNRIGFSSPALNRIVSETALAHGQGFLPGWARERLFAEVFRPSSAEAGVYEDLLRRINQLIDGPQDEGKKVAELSRLLAGFIALTKVGSDLPTLINHAFVASPWVSAIQPGLIDDLIPETLSLLHMNGRHLSADEAAVPIEVVELLVRVWFRHAAELPLGEAIFAKWKAAKLAEGGALAQLIQVHDTRLQEIMPAFFVHSTQRYLYLPDLVVTVQDILETDMLPDKDRALHHLVISLRGASKQGDPIASIRREVFLEPLTPEDYRLHFRAGAKWYESDPTSRVIFDVLSGAASAAYSTQSYKAFRDAVEVKLFFDEPPRLMAALRMLYMRADLQRTSMLPNVALTEFRTPE